MAKTVAGVATRMVFGISTIDGELAVTVEDLCCCRRDFNGFGLAQ
jgi:hypothetical protein